jgi:hypothetical protein
LLGTVVGLDAGAVKVIPPGKVVVDHPERESVSGREPAWVWLAGFATPNFTTATTHLLIEFRRLQCSIRMQAARR